MTGGPEEEELVSPCWPDLIHYFDRVVSLRSSPDRNLEVGRQHRLQALNESLQEVPLMYEIFITPYVDRKCGIEFRILPQQTVDQRLVDVQYNELLWHVVTITHLPLFFDHSQNALLTHCFRCSC